MGIRKTEPGILVLAPSMHGQEAASLRTDFMGEEYLTTKSTKDTKDDFLNSPPRSIVSKACFT
jgi:hypothetical protein